MLQVRTAWSVLFFCETLRPETSRQYLSLVLSPAHLKLRRRSQQQFLQRLESFAPLKLFHPYFFHL